MPGTSAAPDTEEIPSSEEAPRFEPAEIIARARRDILAGTHWFDAVLDAVASWTLPEEDFDGRRFRYLIGREAFDWLLLAQRLTEAITDLVPVADREAMLFQGKLPGDVSEEELRERFGQRKYRAHLNYFYGVTVEEALQLAVEEEVTKNRTAYVWSDVGEEIFERIYGKRRDELFERYREDTGRETPEIMSYSDLQQLTYWLFKFRVNRSDPAKVASDTRKGLAMLSRMELAKRNRPDHVESVIEDIIDV